MTKDELKRKFKENHSRIKYNGCRIFPITGRKGNTLYWVQIGHSDYLYKNKKDALKIFWLYCTRRTNG